MTTGRINQVTNVRSLEKVKHSKALNLQNSLKAPKC